MNGGGADVQKWLTTAEHHLPPQFPLPHSSVGTSQGLSDPCSTLSKQSPSVVSSRPLALNAVCVIVVTNRHY